MKIFEIIKFGPHFIIFYWSQTEQRGAKHHRKVLRDNNIQDIIKPATCSTMWRQAHLGTDIRRNPKSWFKLCFSCFKYKYTYMNNIIYPGSDNKPKACTYGVPKGSKRFISGKAKLF